MNVYVLPTEEGMPPRAIVSPAMVVTEDALLVVEPIEVSYSRDTGAWMAGDIPVPSDMSQAITEHAEALGVNL